MRSSIGIRYCYVTSFWRICSRLASYIATGGDREVGVPSVQSTPIRAAIHIAAVFAIYLSIFMLIPAAVDLYYGHEDWKVFTASAFFTGGLALAVAIATNTKAPPVSPRFGFLLVNLLWVTMCLAGAVPFLASSLEMSPTDAAFEAVAGVTTTGATVISKIDGLPPGMLLWRSILQWMGGLGVIALGLFLLPFLNVGGVSYFKIESSDIDDRPFARFSTFAAGLISIYAVLTIACGLAYATAGMSAFDAINHSLTTVSTAGFSTHDASLGHYGGNAGVLWVGTVFMFIGGLPFSALILFLLRGRLDAALDPQIRIFAAYVVLIILAVTIYLRVTAGYGPFRCADYRGIQFHVRGDDDGLFDRRLHRLGAACICTGIRRHVFGRLFRINDRRRQNLPVCHPVQPDPERCPASDLPQHRADRPLRRPACRRGNTASRRIVYRRFPVLVGDHYRRTIGNGS